MMKQVLCTLPNCSEEVSGVAFSRVAGGMLSAPISDAEAVRFCSIPGYVLAETNFPTDPQPSDPAGSEHDESSTSAALPDGSRSDPGSGGDGPGEASPEDGDSGVDGPEGKGKKGKKGKKYADDK